MSATVIIPTTGAPEVRNAIESVLKQTYPTTCYLVCDGSEHQEKVTAIAFDYVKYKNFKISSRGGFSISRLKTAYSSEC